MSQLQNICKNVFLHIFLSHAIHITLTKCTFFMGSRASDYVLMRCVFVFLLSLNYGNKSKWDFKITITSCSLHYILSVWLSMGWKLDKHWREMEWKQSVLIGAGFHITNRFINLLRWANKWMTQLNWFL